MMVSVRKALSPGNASCMVLFIRANMIKKEKLVQIISQFRVGTLNGAAPNVPPIHGQQSLQTPPVEAVNPFGSLLLSLGFLTRKQLYSPFALPNRKGRSHESLFPHFQIQARPRRRRNHRYQVGAACRLRRYNELAGICAAGHSLKTKLYTQPSPAQIRRRRTGINCQVNVITHQRCQRLFWSGPLQGVTPMESC